MMTTLNAHYLAHVAPAASREMVEAHAPIHGGCVETPCYVTAAAVAWLLTWRDVAPPFSGCWLSAAEGTGPADADRVIAYGTVDDDLFFEPEHISSWPRPRAAWSSTATGARGAR